MSQGTVVGGDRARLDSRGLALVAWLRANGCEASADYIATTGELLEADYLATVVGNRIAPGDPRAAGAAVMPVREALDRLGPLDVSGCETDAEVERQARVYWDTVVALATRTTRQRLAISGVPPEAVARLLGLRPSPAPSPLRLLRVRSRTRSRRRGSRVIRSGCSPGREPPPEPHRSARLERVRVVAASGDTT